MEKICSLICCSVFFFIGSVVFGQTGGTAQIDSEVFEQASAEVQNVEVKFCENDSKTKQYAITAGKQQDICLEIINGSDKDIILSMDFVDGTLTNDQWKNRACKDNNQKEIFGQYISGIENSFTIPAKGSIIKHATLMYPKGMQGDFLGCLVYYTKGFSLGGTMDFNVLVRRAKFIDITIKKTFVSAYKREITIAITIIIIMIVLATCLMGKTTHHTKKHKR